MKPLLYLLVGLIFPGFIIAQKNLPAWVKMQDVFTVPPVNIEHSNNGYYYLLFEEQYNTILKQNFFHYAQKITSESGSQSCAQVETSYDPSFEKIEFNLLRIIRNGKVIDKLDASQFRILNEENERNDGILTNKKTIYRNLNDVQVGDVVEYAYSRYGYKKIFGDKNSFNISLGYSEPSGQLHIKAFFTKVSKPHLYSFNTEIKCNIDSSGNCMVYEWNLSDQKPIITEETYPAWHNPYPFAVITNYTNWNELKKLNREIVLAKNNQNNLCAKIVNEQLKDCKTEDEKITGLIDYVQNKVRYTGVESGIYTHTAHSPNEVVKNMYGDCKDKSVLLCELFKRIGLTAYPVLVSTEYKGKVSELPPADFWFNHCIVALQTKEKEYKFIDPTVSMQGGSWRKKKDPNYEKAIVLDTTQVIFTDIPTDKTSDTEVREVFKIDPSTREATLTVVSQYRGSSADNNRYYFHDNSLHTATQSYKEYYNRYSTEIQVIDSIRFVDNISENEFIVYEKYLLPDFWVAKDISKSKNIEKDFIPYVLNDNIIYGESQTRKHPLQLTFPVNIDHQIKVIMEGGWDVKEKNFELKNNFFRYRYSTAVNGNTLTLTYFLFNYQKFVAPDNYPEYKKQTDLINENMVFTSLVQNDTEPKKFNYIYFISILCTLTLSAFVIRHLHKIKIETNFDEKYSAIGGWLVIVAINVILTPVLLLVANFGSFFESIELDYNALYFSKTASLRDYFNGIFEISVAVFNIFILLFSAYLIFIFFKRKNTFRLYFVSLKVFNIAFIAVNIIYLNYYNKDIYSTEIAATVSKLNVTLVSLIINFAVWGSYVWFSQRSRHTFTTGNKTFYSEL